MVHATIQDEEYLLRSDRCPVRQGGQSNKGSVSALYRKSYRRFASYNKSRPRSAKIVRHHVLGHRNR